VGIVSQGKIMVTTEGGTRTSYKLTFTVLVAGIAAYALLQSLVIPVLATIQVDLHTTQANAAWILTIYLLSASVFTPIVGRLGDMWGKRLLLMVALFGLAGGCVLSALASSIWVMLLGRAIQGVGGGTIPLAFGIIRDEFPTAKVAGAVGAVAGLAAAGGGAGLVLAGPIVSALSWRWLFWVPMVLLTLSAVAAYFFVPESPRRVEGRVNWKAAALLSVWLIALLVPLSEGPQWGWGTSRVIGLFAVSAIAAVAWIMVEQRSARPLIDMRMMRIPVVWTSNLVALLLGAGMYANFAFLPQLLQTPRSAGYGFGLTITQSGLTLLPQASISFAAGVLCGRLTLRFGGKALLVAGGTIGVISFVILTADRTYIWEILLATVLMGAGFNLAYAAMSNLIVEGVPRHQTGVATGMNANIRTLGGCIGTAAMTSAVTATAHGGSFPTSAGYTHGFALLALTTLGAAGAAVLVPKRLRTPTKSQLEEALLHPQMGLVAGGTLLGDQPE
jgi:EmrB/QacA subfamily drug resistance transporter